MFYEIYDNWQNLLSIVQREGVTMPRRQFFIYIKSENTTEKRKQQSNPIKHYNKTKLKKDSNALLKHSSYVKNIPFIWTFWIIHIKILHKRMSSLEVFLTIKVPTFFQKSKNI